MMEKFGLYLVAAVAAVSLAAPIAAANAAQPLDLRQSYSGRSDVAVSYIETFNYYADGGFGTTNSFSFDAGQFSFEDPFLKSSANPPLLTLFAGVSTDESEVLTFAPFEISAPTQHLILALGSGYAAGLVSGGDDFQVIFPGYDEASLINDLIQIGGGTSDQDAIDAAQQELVNFYFGIYNRGGLTPAFGGPFTLLSFSSATSVGDGTAAATVLPGESAVPEPATWAMMIGGIGLVGGAMRRRRTTVRVSYS